MSLYDKASLVLIPSGTKAGKVYSQKPTSGDGDFDFTRSSYATRVNSQGLIEKERSNLLLQSNSFDTTWDNTSTDESGGQSGYDGSSDAWLLTKTVSGFSYLYQSVSSSNVQTFSVYAKANTFDYIRLLVIGSSNNPYAYYDLSNGTLGSVHSSAINAKIESIGNGWYRCSLVYNETISQARIYPIIDDGDFTGTGSIFIQDAQLEQGLVATDVIETTTSAVYEGITDNVPRLDYDGDCPSLLLEPQRTNEIPNTEEMTGVSMSSSTFQYNQGISPDGTNNAIKVTRGTNDVVMRFRNVVETSKTYTFSIYVKTISGTKNVSVDITDDNVTYFTATTTWQRISTTVTVTRTPQSEYHFADFTLVGSTQGDSILIYAPQVEEGSYATSYIPTYGTSVTRTGDLCNNAGDSTIFNDEEGVLYAEIAALSNDGTDRVIEIRNSTNSQEYLNIRIDQTDNRFQMVVRAQGANSTTRGINVNNALEFNKIAIRYKQGESFRIFANGNKEDDTGSAGNPTPSGLDQLLTQGNFIGKIKSILYFDRALTDTELADLTS